MRKLFVFFISILLFFLSFNFVKAQSSDCNNTQNLNLHGANQCLAELQKALDLSKAATAPLESQLRSFQNQIDGIKRRVSQIEASLIVKSANIEKGYEDFAQQKAVFDKTVTEHYIEGYNNNLLAFFLSGNSATELVQNLAYQKAKANQDKSIITNIALLISDLETQKKSLEAEQVSLASLKVNLDAQSAKLDAIVSEARAYQNVLSTQIANLTALQQSILTGKSGTFTTSVGDVPLADDPNASPTYNPGFSPAFGAFSFGAYTHRMGMSQYGAKGRADGGANYDQILRAYYNFDGYEDRGGITIKVNDGNGVNQGNIIWTGSLEDYVKRIYEVPGSWPSATLQAQAIAARSYALGVTNNGEGSICANQNCQVFQSNPKGGNWESAVVDTSGKVMISGGQPVKAYYSSTTGGYITTKGWDTTSGTRDTWTSGAYEKIAGSPWFYKGWYTETYNNNSNKCGRSHPWLNQEEMADILNAYLIQNKSGVDNGRITPITTSCWGGNPYSMDEARSLAGNVGGGAVTSISSSPSVVYSNDGSTASVSFSTNRGTITINGADFKKIFNLRAPGYISIRSPLFNIEKK